MYAILKFSCKRLMSARWQIHKPQSCFYHRNTTLTMIYRPKYLYEVSRIQLRSCSTSREYKLKTAALKWVRREISLPQVRASPKLHRSVPGKNTPASDSSLGTGKERSGACIQHSNSLEGCLKDWYLLCLLYSTDRTTIVWLPECC